MNGAFARTAVRAAGYHRAGVSTPDSEPWSPVASVDANGKTPSDVVAWLDAGDITPEGVFAPCPDLNCPSITLSDEQRAVLEPWLRRDGALLVVQQVSAAALRLTTPATEQRWLPGLDAGFLLLPDEGAVQINPQLLELLNDSPQSSTGASAPTTSPSIGSGRNDSDASSLRPLGTNPLPHEAPPQPNAPVLRSHEPPPGHGASDGGDCDCDCDFIDVRCAIQPAAAGQGPYHAIIRPLLLVLAGAALLLRRTARSRRGSARFRGSTSQLLPLLALGLATHTAEAQTPDAASQLEAGKALLARKDYSGAIQKLEAARTAGVGRDALELLARAYEDAGRRPEAYALLSELLQDSGSMKPVERERLQHRAQALESRLAFVNVQVQPAQASVLVNGHPAITDPRSKQIVVTPGPQHISARAEGFVESGKTVLAPPGSRNTVVALSLAPNSVIAEAPQKAPPPAAAAPVEQPPAKPKRTYRFRTGPYVVGHLGFALLTARPSGFRYETRMNEETNQQTESPGLSSLFGATAGMRLTRGVGIGGLVMYGRGGGDGTVTQLELGANGNTLSHEGPAEFTQQALRVGPHFRFMAGGDIARFLAGTSVGGVYAWVDLEHVDVTTSGDTLIERGNFRHEYSGLNPYWGFDLGAEFSIADHLLLGFGLDVLIERTANLTGNPFGGTAQGYVGFSARAGFHDWKPE